MHRRIAALLAADPQRVLAKALDNLDRWSLRRNDAASQAIFVEWRELLTSSKPSEIATFLTSPDERALRMRQSSPFAGVLPPREIWAIKRDHEAA